MSDQDDLVRSTIADGLAALTRLRATPVEPFGYGTDISCDSDVSPTLEMVDPFSTLGIAQAVIRRWGTPRGGLPPDGKDAQDYGEDVRSWCNTGVTERDLRAKRSKLESEALKESTIAAIEAPITMTRTGAQVEITIDAVITPKDPNLASFPLVLAVTSADIVIKAIGGAL